MTLSAKLPSLTAAALLFIGCAAHLQQPEAVAFVDVSVIPMDSERVVSQQTVIVAGDRIMGLGPTADTPVPGGARRIDGRGKFLMPGLVEMHGHIPGLMEPRDEIESTLFLFVANGITTVRGMLGAPNQLTLRAQANSRAIVSPTLYLAGPGWTGQPAHSPEQAAAQVRREKDAGWDFFKVHAGLARNEYDAVVRTAREVGHPVAGHVPAAVDLMTVLKSGQRTIDHLDGFLRYLDALREPIPESKLVDVANRTKQAGVSIVPTIVVTDTVMGNFTLEQVKTYPELKYLPPRVVREWSQNYRKWITWGSDVGANVAANQRRIVKAFHDRRVPILLGTDSPQLFNTPGFSIHREIRAMNDAGMSAYDVLRAGTSGPGAYFRDHDLFGVVSPRYRADLLLLDANPLDDLRNLTKRPGVMLAGRWLPESAVQDRLRRVSAAYEAGQAK